MCGKTKTGRVVHVVCAPKGDYLAIITAYVPSLEKWATDLKTRKKAMKCMLCGGNLEKSAASYTVDRKGYHLFIEKIPAYVCARCGEKAFDEKEVIAIQNMLKAFEDKLEQVQMVA